MSKVTAHVQKKNKTFMYSFRFPNKESGKIKKRGCRALYLGPCKISMIGRLCENTTVKGYIRNV